MPGIISGFPNNIFYNWLFSYHVKKWRHLLLLLTFKTLLSEGANGWNHSDSVTLVGTAHIEAKRYSDIAVPNKHCCDNSKHVFTEIPDTWPRSYHCYTRTENRVSVEVVRQNRVTRPRDKVFTSRAERSYLRRTDAGAISTHVETDTTQYCSQAASVWRHALIRCPLVIVVLHIWESTGKGSCLKKITVIMYPNEQSYMPNDSVNIEKHIKTYLRNTCVFNVNPGNQGSPIIVFSVLQQISGN
jgi:hypothetical protein